MECCCIPVGPLQANCYLLWAGQDAVVIDPGAEPGRLQAILQEKGLCPALIVATHGHFDHVGGVKGLKAAFPAAVTAMSPLDQPQIDQVAGFAMARPFIRLEDFEGLAFERPLAEGDCLQAGAVQLQVLATPGHSPGGVCLRCGELLFSGDTLFDGSVGRSDLPGGDWGALMASVGRLAALPGDFRLLPGHGPASTLAQQRKTNPYIR